jgi:hypothetical protein
VACFPGAESLFSYEPEASTTGMKRKSGLRETGAEGQELGKQYGSKDRKATL